MSRPPSPSGIESRWDATGKIASYRAVVKRASIGKRNGVWTTDLEEALAERDHILAQLTAGRLSHKAVRLDEAIDTFTEGIADGTITNKSGKRYRPSTVRGYTRDLNRVKRWHPNTKLDELETHHVAAIRRRLRKRGVGNGPLSDSAANNVIKAIKALYNWAVQQAGLAKFNPARDVPLPVGDEIPRDRIASLKEAALLISAITSLRDRVALALACYAGLRAQEVLALDWKHVNLELLQITVVDAIDTPSGAKLTGPKTDAGKRIVPIRDILLLLLEDLAAAHGQTGLLFPATRPRRGHTIRAGASMSLSAHGKRVKKTWRELGLRPLGMHEARHTFASMVIAAQVAANRPDYKQLSVLMGHSSIQITIDRYSHLYPESLASVREMMNGYDAS